MSTQNLNNIPVALSEGTKTTLGILGGKATLVVNVASKCGFTAQYSALETLYQTFKERGLVVLGIPCNQFGAQEPGTEEEIVEFCQKNFGVTFPLGTKVDVNGTDAHPLFAELTSQGTDAVKWNFEKFLLSSDGVVLARFDSATTPDSPELVTAVESALA